MQVPTPVVEYIAPMPAVCAEPAPVRKYTAPPPAVSYVAPAPMVDVLGPQFHDDIAETSCKATPCGGRVRKSARLSSNAPEVFEFECGSDSSLRPLPRRRRRLADDKTLPETLPEMYEIAENETSPEIHDIADRGFEEAANLMLTLCQQNEMEKHGKSREIQHHIETETRRAMWHIVENIYRGWRVSPTLETVGTSVNGILGASYDFWDEDEEDEDGPPIIRVEEQEWLEIIQHLLTQDVRVREW